MERPAEVIEHVVASAVDDAGLEDGPAQARTPNELFCGPLGAVVRRGAVRASAKETQDDDPRDARRSRGLDDGTGSRDMDRLVRLRPDFPVDPGAVRDGLA